MLFSIKDSIMLDKQKKQLDPSVRSESDRDDILQKALERSGLPLSSAPGDSLAFAFYIASRLMHNLI